MITGITVVMATLPVAVVDWRGMEAPTRFNDPARAKGAPLVAGTAFLVSDIGEPAAGRRGRSDGRSQTR